MWIPGQRVIHILVCNSLLVLGSPSCPSECECSPGTIACTGHIPTILPENVSVVHISDPITQNLIGETFRHRSWKNVQRLTLRETWGLYESNEKDDWEVTDYTFENLTSLTHLTISCPTLLDRFDSKAFYGLKKLKHLNVSNAINVNFQTFAHALVGDKGDDYSPLPNLENLDMTDMGALLSIAVDIDEENLKGLVGRPLTTLNMSGIRFGILDMKAIETTLPLLRVLNISRSVISSGADLNITLKNLHVLDISEVFSLYGNFLKYNNFRFAKDNHSFGYLPRAFHSVRELIAHTNLMSNQLTINIVFLEVDLAFTDMCAITRMNLANNNLRWFNISRLSNPICPRMEDLNLCCNGMQYISHGLLSSWTNLKVLTLTGNQLQVMNNHDEFSELLTNNTLLEEIYLEENAFTKLPSDIFQSNTLLTTINLSFNKLTRLDFNTAHLHRLRLLDLSHNDITSIDADTISKLSPLFLHQNQNLENASFTMVLLSDNPLRCSCDSEAGIQFLIENGQFSSDIICDLDGGTVPVNRDVLPQIQYLCIKSAIIASTCVSVCVIIVLGTILTCRLYHKLKCYLEDKRIKQQVKALRRYYLEHPSPVYPQQDKYLAFLSFCKEDEEFVFAHVHDTLQHRLRDQLEIQDDRTVICIADLDFPAGHYIEDSILKAVDASDVVIFLISKAFCKSRWCQYEARVAYYEEKPILLMFREEVPMKELPDVFRYLLKTFVRVTWKIQDGEPVLHPRWNKVCQFILQHRRIE